jgi:hypothetical protein
MKKSTRLKYYLANQFLANLSNIDSKNRAGIQEQSLGGGHVAPSRFHTPRL